MQSGISRYFGFTEMKGLSAVCLVRRDVDSNAAMVPFSIRHTALFATSHYSQDFVDSNPAMVQAGKTVNFVTRSAVASRNYGAEAAWIVVPYMLWGFGRGSRVAEAEGL